MNRVRIPPLSLGEGRGVRRRAGARLPGYTLLEVVLALSLTVVVMSAIGMAIFLHLRSVDHTRTAIERSIEIFVAQTGDRGEIVNRTATGDPVEPDPPGDDTGDGPGTADDGSTGGDGGSGDAGLPGDGASAGPGSGSATSGADTDDAAADDDASAEGCGCVSAPRPLDIAMPPPRSPRSR